jgi:hypothetical protein
MTAFMAASALYASFTPNPKKLALSLPVAAYFCRYRRDEKKS